MLLNVERLSCSLQPRQAGMSGEVMCRAERTPLCSVCQWEQGSRAAPPSVSRAGKKNKKTLKSPRLSQCYCSPPLSVAAPHNDVRNFISISAKDTSQPNNNRVFVCLSSQCVGRSNRQLHLHLGRPQRRGTQRQPVWPRGTAFSEKLCLLLESLFMFLSFISWL